jgi:hypothetical protein
VEKIEETPEFEILRYERGLPGQPFVVFGAAPGRLGVFPGLGVVSIVLALGDLVPATSILSAIVTAG